MSHRGLKRAAWTEGVYAVHELVGEVEVGSKGRVHMRHTRMHGVELHTTDSRRLSSASLPALKEVRWRRP